MSRSLVTDPRSTSSLSVDDDLWLLASASRKKRSLGIPSFIPPDVVQAARASRQAVRSARAAEARTRLLVLGIWGTAVVLTLLLAAFFATGR